tara:strand:+ start:315 stop:545 length:231 start_codon:yes stop_codon:yes gene_type:complete
MNEPMTKDDILNECTITFEIMVNRKRMKKKIVLLLMNMEVGILENTKIERTLTASQLKNGYKIIGVEPNEYQYKIK